MCVNQKVREEIYLSLDTEEEKSGFWEYEIPRRKKKEKSHASIINKSHIFSLPSPPSRSRFPSFLTYIIVTFEVARNDQIPRGSNSEVDWLSLGILPQSRG